jgi:hypothetical protein
VGQASCLPEQAGSLLHPVLLGTLSASPTPAGRGGRSLLHPVLLGVLKVIALDDLIRVKEHIARKKDSESLFQLRAIKRLREETGQR